MSEAIYTKQTALLKFRDALAMLSEEGIESRVVFAPDIIRDAGISQPVGKDLVRELSGEEKDRLVGFITFVRGGGHAFLGANAAMALRHNDKNAQVSVLAKVFPKDYFNLVDQYLIENPREREIAPADTALVVKDSEHPEVSGVNVIFARQSSTTIVLGTQPALRMDDYTGESRRKMIGALESADVVAMLSLKSQFMTDLVNLSEKGELRTKELFCDCTSGSDMAVNYRILDMMRRKNGEGKTPITLLSINEHEVVLFEMLLRRETGERDAIIGAEKERAGLIAELEAAKKAGKTEKEEELNRQIGAKERFISEGKLENPFQAAQTLYEKTGIPLLVHTYEGAYIIGGEKSTRFMPSVLINFPEGSNFVGAGDTLCGAMAIALAVKKKSDGLLPEEKRLSYEDCVMIANLTTAYRLAKVNGTCHSNAHEGWERAVGTVEEIYGWASNMTLRRSTEKALPDEMAFIDAEKESLELFGSLPCMTCEGLLHDIKRFAGQKEGYWRARVAFEELTLREQSKSIEPLVALAIDDGTAGEMFGRRAVMALAGKGENGYAALRSVAHSLQPAIARRLQEDLCKLETEPATEIIVDMFSSMQYGEIYSLEEFIKGKSDGFVAKLQNISRKMPLPGADGAQSTRDIVASMYKRLGVDDPMSEIEDCDQYIEFKIMDFMSEIKRIGFTEQEVTGDIKKAIKTAAYVLAELGGETIGGVWIERPVDKEIRGVIEQTIKKIGMTKELFDCIALDMTLRYGETRFLDLLTTPYNSETKVFLTRYIQKYWKMPGGIEYTTRACHAASVLLKNFVGDPEVEKLCCALLAKNIIGFNAAPEEEGDYYENSDRTETTLKEYYGFNVEYLKKGFASWPVKTALPQPKANETRPAIGDTIKPPQNRDAAANGNGKPRQKIT